MVAVVSRCQLEGLRLPRPNFRDGTPAPRKARGTYLVRVYEFNHIQPHQQCRTQIICRPKSPYCMRQHILVIACPARSRRLILQVHNDYWLWGSSDQLQRRAFMGRWPSMRDAICRSLLRIVRRAAWIVHVQTKSLPNHHLSNYSASRQYTCLVQQEIEAN